MGLENFLMRLLRRETSKEIAKKRLKLVLIQDRIGIEPETMECLKQDLIDLLSRYFEISQSGFQIDLHREEEQVALVANIPITRMKIRHPQAS